MKYNILIGLVIYCMAGLAQATPLYLTQYGGATGAIVETDSGTLIENFTTTVNTETGIAVMDTIRIISGFPGAGSEYDLSGNVIHSGIYVNTNFNSLYDGTTDGQYNYAIDHNGNGTNTVFRFDTNWQNPEVLFTTTQRSSGIAYDAVTNTLWTTGGTDGPPDGNIQQYSMTGQLLFEFSTAAIGGYHYGLAFDSTDSTLWTSNYGTNQLAQFDTSGNLLGQFPVPGLPLDNPFGMEFRFGGEIPPPASIPTLSEWGMIIMALILAGSAFWMIRRRQTT